MIEGCNRIGNIYDETYGGGMDGNVYADNACAPALKAIGGGQGRNRTNGVRTMRTILKSERTDEGKRERKRLGDTGGVSFRNRTNAPREDGMSNAITSVQKDNLLLEIYEHHLLHLRPARP